MTVPDNDGCLWPLDPACLTNTWESEYDDAARLRATALASNTLRRLCAFRVGGCPVTVRPCSEGCFSLWAMSQPFVVGYPFAGAPFVPVNWAGTYTNAWCGCSSTCRKPGSSVRLPPPVYEVTQVTVDGVVIDPANYWVSDGHLIALGNQTWPITQDLNLPATAVGTFEVTYLDSAPVDGQGAYAAAKLAMQFAKACKTGKCDLPSTVVNVVRQGITYSLPAGSFPSGETGIREVDAYIALWNPNHRKTRTMVYSP